MAAVVLTGCSSHDEQPSPGTGSGIGRQKTSAAGARAVSVRLAWSHIVKSDDGDTQVWYVVRVKSPGKSPASVALDVCALDKAGTIVGSGQNTLPNVLAGATFDYFGELGGGLSASLTGTSAKVQVSQNTDAFGQAGAIDQPLLGTGKVTLTKGSPDDLFASAPYSYNLSVKVTNSTHDPVSGGVTQQVVLYDTHGQVVGGAPAPRTTCPAACPRG
ncbi:hypothetical protein QR97_31385 [Streptomyces sp. PBH53]|nr:hypothetical protein QR97_31385 [Streptomyces sp. PBH53]